MTDAPLVHDEPERLLSLGEVAELLGVADMELRRLVRTGSLATRAGWRRGRLTRLVRAGDLCEVDPEVGARVLPARVPSELAEDLPSSEPEPVEAAVEPAPALDQSLDASIGDELEALKADLQATRARGEELMRDLASSDQQVQGLFHDLGREELRTRKQLQRHQRDQEQAERTLVRLRRLQVGAGVLLVALLAVVAQLAWPGDRSGVVLAEEGSGAEVAGVTRAKQQPRILPPTAERTAQDDGAEADGEADAGVIPLDPIVHDVDEPADVEPSSTDLAPESPPESGAVLETLDPGLADGDDPPCRYYPLTRPGAELRALLGPCAGRWSEAHGAVAAAVRRDGVGLCRHHHFFAAQLGGSVERAQEVADLAAREGLVAPLLELRVDRAGAEFLRRRAGEWIESGFEAGLVVGADPHELEPVVDQADTWRVRSWVRYLDIGGVEQRRRFTMTVELGDGPEGDRLRAFDWADDPVR